MRLVEVADMMKKAPVVDADLDLDLDLVGDGTWGFEQGDRRVGLQLMPLPAGNDQSGKCRFGIMISSKTLLLLLSFRFLPIPNRTRFDLQPRRDQVPGTIGSGDTTGIPSPVVRFKESEKKRKGDTTMSMAQSQKSGMIGCQIRC